VKYLFEVQHKDCTINAIECAIWEDHFDIIKYLFEVQHKDCTDYMVNISNPITFSLSDYIEEKAESQLVSVGDVVVSLVDIGRTRYKGNMFIVKNTSSKEHLRYDDLHKCPSLSYDKNDWRLATSEEKEAFKKGITNINDIKKETEENFSKFIGQWVTWDKWINKSVCRVTKIEKKQAFNNYLIHFDKGYNSSYNNNFGYWSADIKELKILSKEELKDYLPEDVYNKEFSENIVPEYLELLPKSFNHVLIIRAVFFLLSNLPRIPK
jgi:hypothetical protein